MEAIGTTLQRLTSDAAPGQTLPSTCSSHRLAPSPVPPQVQNLISKLGLRYRPTSNVDLDAHAALLALLASDLAEMPPAILDRAIKAWALQSPFMPKAYDLVKLAREFVSEDRPPATQSLAEKYNERMAADPEARRDRKWIDLPDGGVKLVPCDVPF